MNVGITTFSFRLDGLPSDGAVSGCMDISGVEEKIEGDVPSMGMMTIGLLGLTGFADFFSIIVIGSVTLATAGDLLLTMGVSMIGPIG